MADIKRTAFDDFADKLHELPPAGQPQPQAYYDDLAAMLPAVVAAIKPPVTGDTLNGTQITQLLTGITARADGQARAFTDKDGKVTPNSYTNAQQAVTTLIHDATKRNGEEATLSVADLQARIRQPVDKSKPDDPEQQRNFQNMMISVHKGLAQDPLQIGNPVWTMERLMGVLKALVTGDFAGLQNLVAQANAPQKLPPAPGAEADTADFQNPLMAEIAALTNDMVNEAFQSLNGPPDEFGVYNSEGPISQAGLAEIQDPAMREYFAAQFKPGYTVTYPDGSTRVFERGASLDIVLEENMASSPRFQEFIARHGLDEQQADMLRTSIRQSIIAQEKGVTAVNAYHLGGIQDPHFKHFLEKQQLAGKTPAQLLDEAHLKPLMEQFGIEESRMEDLKQTIQAHVKPVYMASIDGRAAADEAARDYALKAGDPSLHIPPGQKLIEGHLDAAIKQNGYQLSHRVPGDFALRMTEAAGFNLGTATRDNLFTRQTEKTGPHGVEIETMNLDRIPAAASGFFKDALAVASEKMVAVRGLAGNKMQYNDEVKVDDVKAFIEQHKGNPAYAGDIKAMKDVLADKNGLTNSGTTIPAQTLLERMVSRDLGEKYRHQPEILQKLGIGKRADLGADSGRQFAEVARPSEDDFDVRQTFNGLTVGPDGKITGGGGLAIQLSSPQGGIPLYKVHSGGTTADGERVVNYDVIDRVGVEDLHKITGGKPFSLSFLAERDGKQAAGWFLETQDGKRMYMGLGSEAGLPEENIPDAMKKARWEDPVPNGQRPGPQVSYQAGPGREWSGQAIAPPA